MAYICMNNGCRNWNSKFLEITKNHLAGIQSRQVTHTNFEHFLGSCKEPLGGMLGAGWQRVTYHPVLGFSDEGPGSSD